ncbi:MAG TPA: DUF2125 domain-containing protein [Pseudolabrys sp.]|nr:DUF2125 domain-containing protein [Pseudolabrys sp.]
MSESLQSRRRTGIRYAILLFLVLALIAGWSAFWKLAAGKAETAIEGWRAREAKAGRIYACGSQTVGGYPFRIEVNCERTSALFQSNQPPVEVKTDSILVAAQIYQPGLLISEFHGPLTAGEPGKPPEITADWKLAQSSVRGTPAAPERVSLLFDQPAVDRMDGTTRQNLLRAKRVEIHGRIAEGSAVNKPVIEIVTQLTQATAPTLHPAAAQPIDADVTAMLRGLNDFSPKPWPARFREIQAAGGRIDITKARVQQGDILATGSGALSINSNGHLEGELRITMAGVDQFLAAMGVQQRVQSSESMDKIVGALDRIMPGLGGVARQQAGANLSVGVNLLGEQTTLEGKRAVALPLRFTDGAAFLGPVPIGNVPPLF